MKSHAPIVIAIMCGGGGTRLWPVSRLHKPKQLQPLITEKSMLTETASRLNGPEINVAQLMLITGEVFSDQAARAVTDDCGSPFGTPSLVIEPEGRNTAPCAAAACLMALEQHDDRIIVLLPADHHIGNAPEFRKALSRAAEIAQEGYIVTLGIPPTGPETGFGYIKAGKTIANGFLVERFVEKPDQKTAQVYVETGGYFWNAGVFVTRAQVLIDELQRLSPAIFDAVNAAVQQGTLAEGALTLAREPWLLCPSDSIDYAVAEKTNRAAIMPIDVGWSDVGSWSAIWELLDKDTFGNVTIGDTLLEATSNSLVRADSRLVATIGLDDVIVIETRDSVLIVSKSHVQDIKKIVQRLNADHRVEAITMPPT